MSVENLFDVSFVVGQQNGGMPLTIAGGEIQSFAASASGQLTSGWRGDGSGARSICAV